MSSKTVNTLRNKLCLKDKLLISTQYKFISYILFNSFSLKRFVRNGISEIHLLTVSTFFQ